MSDTSMMDAPTAGATPAAEPPLLEIHGIRKGFPGVVALDNVGFKLRAGTVHALMGENGAGKSTLMKIIAGIYMPDRGDISLKGQRITLKSPIDALNQGKLSVGPPYFNAVFAPIMVPALFFMVIQGT